MHKNDSSLCKTHPHQFRSHALPEDVSGFAVFLDVDGTLLDIASTPDDVVVPPGLPGALERMSHRLGGALALITGRPLATIDHLFAGIAVSASGLHGAEWRDGSRRMTGVVTTPDFELAKARLRAQVALWPGTVFEDKGVAFAAH
jgi:trehalose 6-phosphate phosphatase